MSEEKSWHGMQEWVHSSELEAVLLTSYQAVTYFAGTHLQSQQVLPDRVAYALITADEPVLVVCAIEASQARAQSGINSIRGYTEFVDVPEQILAQELNKAGLSSARIGVEMRRMAAASRDELVAAAPSVTLIGIDDTVEHLQMVKRKSVCDGLTSAARATQAAIEAAAAAAAPGATELDLSSSIVAAVARAGGSPTFCFLGSGRRALQGHPEASSERLQAGTIWRTDVGGRFEGGLMSDVARTGVVGKPTVDQERAFLTVRDAQRAGLEKLRAGARARHVFAAVAETIRGAGYVWEIPHVGHGLGVGIHEEPIFAPSNDLVLEPGMVVNIEPILLLPDRGEAYHVEDLAVITDGGFRLLTTPQTQLLRVAA